MKVLCASSFARLSAIPQNTSSHAGEAKEATISQLFSEVVGGKYSTLAPKKKYFR
jgi:hypothetical protein